MCKNRDRERHRERETERQRETETERKRKSKQMIQRKMENIYLIVHFVWAREKIMFLLVLVTPVRSEIATKMKIYLLIKNQTRYLKNIS